MIAFVLVLLWAPSVIGGCGDLPVVTGACDQGTCTDSCYIWREGPMYCVASTVSDLIIEDPAAGNPCDVVPRPDLAKANWVLNPVDVGTGKGCELQMEGTGSMAGGFTTQSQLCKCNDSPHCKPSTKTKSTLSTGAIIGITLAVLFIVITIAFIYRSRSTLQTGEQLIQ